MENVKTLENRKTKVKLALRNPLKLNLFTRKFNFRSRQEYPVFIFPRVEKSLNRQFSTFLILRHIQTHGKLSRHTKLLLKTPKRNVCFISFFL